MSKISRRRFLQTTAVAGGALLLPACASEPPEEKELHKRIGETATICPYCSVGCGLLVATDEKGHISNVEGDPENPVSRGVLCPKAISVRQLVNSPLRVRNVMYRAPGSTQWETKSWEWALGRITERVKKTRDETFVGKFKIGDKDVTVNRAEGIAWLGGAANNNEDCYLATKLMRSLGVVYLEHQARI